MQWDGEYIDSVNVPAIQLTREISCWIELLVSEMQFL